MLLKDSIPTESFISPANYTQPALIVSQLRERETAGVIKELSQLLHQEGCVPDVLPFYNAALNREFLVNTAIESGLAFPHARLSGQRQLVFALGRSDEPLVWGPRGTQPVRLVFLLAVPATDAANYILLIGSLTRLSRELALLERLHKARDSFEMFDVLKEVRLQSGRASGA